MSRSENSESDNTENEAETSHPKTIEKYSPTAQDIKLRIKFLDESSKEIIANPNQKLEVVKTMISEDADLSKLKFVRQGKILDDEKTLTELSISDNNVIHVSFISRSVIKAFSI